MAPSFNENLITTRDAGEFSGYTSDYLARLARSGKITGKRIGHSWLIDKESLVRFLGTQGDRKFEYARALAHTREIEYRTHRSVLNRATKMLTRHISPRDFASGIAESSVRSQVFALSIAALVVAAGALGAQSPAIPYFAEKVGAIAREAASGFGSTFGDIPVRIASKIASADDAMRSAPQRVQRAGARMSEDFIQPLALLDVSLARAPIPSFGNTLAIQERKSATPVFSVAAPFETPILTVETLQSSVRAIYTALTSPSVAARSFAHGYVAVGIDVYAGIRASFTAYDSLVRKVGAQVLTFAATTRDVLTASPLFVSRVNLALGTAVIDATHALIRADVSAAYGIARAAPESARATVALVGSVGDVLARATSRVPVLALAAFSRATAVPALLAPRIAGAVFDVEYIAANHFVSLVDTVTREYALALQSLGEAGYASAKGTRNTLHTAGALLASVRPALEDAYLSALGKSALVLDTVARSPSVAAALSAAQPALSTTEYVALATYETIHGFFNSAGRALAILFGSTGTEPLAPVTPVILPETLAVATSTPKTPAPRTASYSYPTYTTIVRGISQTDLDQSLATLRNGILGTVAGMIQPVSSQVATNANTIQYVSMIQDLSNLIVRNGDFRGGVFDSGIRVSATDGTFTNLTGGATNLGATTVTGTLTTNGAFTSLASATAPYFVATSTTATSTFAGRLAIGTTTPFGDGLFTVGTTSPLLHISSNSGNIGIGTTSPLATLGIQGSIGVNDSQLYLAANGRIGIGTTSPLATLGIQGSIGVNDSQLYLAANGRIGVGTTSPDAFISILQTVNGVSMISAYRATDITPSGDFISYKMSDGTALFRVDNSGNLLAGGIINSGSQTITSTSQPQFRVQYDSSNEITTSVGSTGTTTIGVSGSSPSLSFTPGSNSVNTFRFTDALAANSVLSIDTLNQRVGIGTTSPYTMLSVAGQIVGTYFTATSTTFASTFPYASSTALTVSGLSTLGTLSLTAGTSTSFFATTASSTNLFAQTASLGSLSVTNTSTSTFSGNVSVSGNINLNGALLQNDAPFIGSQWTTLGSSLYYNTGNVGIGTTSPGSLLSIGGAGTGWNFFDNATTTSYAKGIDLRNGGCFAMNGTCLTSGPPGTAGQTLSYVDTTLTATSTLTITSAGNVGIGTSTPNWLFQVAGTRPSFALTDTAAAVNQKHWLFSSMGGNLYIGTSTDAYATSTPSALTILNNGNIGIGTSSPYALLSVAGLAAAGYYNADNAAATSTFAGGLDVGSGALSYDFSANKTYVERLSTGPLAFEADSGVLSLVDMAVTSAAVASTSEGYSMQLNGNQMLTIWGESDGAGDIMKTRVVIGTSTDATLDSANIPYGSLIVSDGALCVDDSGGDSCAATALTRGQLYAESATVGTVDLAENFPTEDTTLAPGEIVSADPANTLEVVRYDATATSSPPLGIVSTAPGFLLGAGHRVPGTRVVPIALAGRVPLKVSLKNGPIHPGDYLTPSLDMPGYGVKALTSGMMIGTALESTDASATSTGTAIVTTFVRPQFAFIGNSSAFTINVENGVLPGDTGSFSTDDFFDTLAETATTSAVLTADGKNLDLYKLATFALHSSQTFADKLTKQEVRLTALEARVTALESGAVSSGGSVSLSTTSLASALNSFGVFISHGFAQFGSLIADQFVAATNSAGTSSAGTVVIPAGSTVAQVDNAYVKSSTKIFMTLTSAITGSWYISDKQSGSFKVILSGAQSADVSFDYFIVQTEGQIATSTPEVIVIPPPVVPEPDPDEGSATSTPSSGSGDTVPPVVTLVGDAAIEIDEGQTFIDPGATATDDVDGDLTSGIVITGAVDTATAALYTLTYSATDIAGNEAHVSRVVTVAATSTPSI